MIRSLRLRLFWVHALLLIGAIAIVSFLEVRIERRWLLARNATSLERVARQAARFLPDDAASRAGQWARALTARDSATGLRFTLIRRDGRVFADTRVDSVLLDDHSDRTEVKAALRGGVGTSVHDSHALHIPMQYVAVPAYGHVPYAVVRVAEPLEMVRRLDASLEQRALLTAALTVHGMFVVLYLLTGRQMERVSELEQVAGRIGASDPLARALELPDDELGRLGAALNRMSAELRDRLAALEIERDEREIILGHMNDGVALLDGQGRILHCNKSLAVLLGVESPAEPGTPFAAFVRSPELDELVRRARAVGGSRDMDLRLWTPRPRFVRANVTPLGVAKKDAVLLVLHDLTEIESVNRVRQDFVANVSHELRTPLTSLRGYAETLLDGGLEDLEHREHFVQVIREQAVRLEALVNDLLSLAELERPDAPRRDAIFDLRVAAARQVTAFSEAARRSGLTLTLEAGERAPVHAESSRLEQVLANLLDNAIKYTEHGGVTVRVGVTGARGWCEVGDTGPGIPEDELPRIFERFYRVDKARSREKGGTGLGLSIVKHIVALHDGEVSVESEVGKGSTFRFELPGS